MLLHCIIKWPVFVFTLIYIIQYSDNIVQLVTASLYVPSDAVGQSFLRLTAFLRRAVLRLP